MYRTSLGAGLQALHVTALRRVVFLSWGVRSIARSLWKSRTATAATRNVSLEFRAARSDKYVAVETVQVPQLICLQHFLPRLVVYELAIHVVVIVAGVACSISHVAARTAAKNFFGCRAYCEGQLGVSRLLYNDNNALGFPSAD